MKRVDTLHSVLQKESYVCKALSIAFLLFFLCLFFFFSITCFVSEHFSGLELVGDFSLVCAFCSLMHKNHSSHSLSLDNQKVSSSSFGFITLSGS